MLLLLMLLLLLLAATSATTADAIAATTAIDFIAILVVPFALRREKNNYIKLKAQIKRLRQIDSGLER
jgi:hypothetical protein